MPWSRMGRALERWQDTILVVTFNVLLVAIGALVVSSILTAHAR
jgi:hypothetical protein